MKIEKNNHSTSTYSTLSEEQGYIHVRWGEIWKGEEKKGESVKEKGRKGKEKEKMGTKRVK